mmetsp:Transcript_15771/g.61620  ORF Transcript_15771/g.61620 Transcript_15771/m.61620 type:complete len:316 (-) Transcript_15771:157-1104(-)
MVDAAQREAGLAHARAEELGVLLQPLQQLGDLVHHAHGLAGGCHDGGRHCVGKEVRPRALTQKVHHCLASASEAAAGAAQRLAKGRVHDVYLVHDAKVLWRAPAGGAKEAARVALVRHQHGPVALAHFRDRVERRHVAVHREDAVRGHHLYARAVRVRLLQLGLEVGEVHVLVAVALGLAEAHAVDDRRVVQLVRQDRVFRRQQGLEEACVGVEAAGIENAVLLAVEARHLSLQLLVDVLRAADEAHRAEAIAARVQRLLGSRLQPLVVRQAQVVVGAEVEHRRRARAHANAGPLRRRDHALALVRARSADALQL